MRNRLGTIIAGCAAALVGPPAGAQLPFPELTAVFPAGAQAGTAVELSVAGAEIEDATELIFSHPGITSAPVEEPATEFRPAHPVPGRFRVTVGPGVPPGLHEVVARTRLGFTAPRTFVVGSRPEVLHAGDNDNPETPMPLPLGTVVNGHVDADQIDYYQLDLKRDQRVVIQCRGELLDSRIDATLVVIDAAGRELARDRDTIGRDAVIDFTAPADGPYLVQVFDFIYRGGVEFSYRLLADDSPHLDFVYPPAGPEGTTGKFKLYGRNLPGGSKGEGVRLGRHELESIEVDIHLAREDDPLLSSLPVPTQLLPGMNYQLEHDGLRSNSLRIGFASAPIVEGLEQDRPQTVAPPCEIHARFDQRGDLDLYQFEATKGSPLAIECIAHRGHSGLDPLLIIERITRDDQGREKATELTSGDDPGAAPGGRHFPMPVRDPVVRFTPPEDGTYRVTILNQSGPAGAAAIYRLVIRPASPDFELIATATSAYLPDKQVRRLPTLLRRGGTAVVEVVALRRDGFAGEIVVTAEGLPAGVSCPPITIRSGQNSGTLILSCADDATAWNGFLTVQGAADGTVHTARAGTVSWAVGNWDLDYARARLATRLPLSVCAEEQAPLVIQSPAPARLEVDLDGKLEIPVSLVKNVPVKGDVIVRPEGLPFKKNPPQLKIKEADREGKIEITFKKTNDFPIEPGEWQFALRAEGIVKYRNNPEAAAQAEAERKRLEELEKTLQAKANEARAAVDPARKALQEAENNLKSASAEATGALEAAVTQARADVQEAENRAKETDDLAKRAANEKNRAAEQAKRAAEQAKERDVKHATYSTPFTVVIKPPPAKDAGK